MTKEEAEAVYRAHCYGIEVPVEKIVEAVTVLQAEKVLVR